MTHAQELLIGDAIYPTPEVIANAHLSDYHAANQAAHKDLSTFWGRIAAENFEWYTPWQQVLDESNAPFYKWFAGAKVNIVHNALDRHLRTAVRNKAALIYENEKGTSRVYTYQQLHYEVCQFASVLQSLQVGKGSHIAILLGRTPELIIATLACAKVGAVATILGCDWSAEQINGRLAAHHPQLLITADGTYHNGQTIPLKQLADTAIADLTSCPIICLRHTGQPVSLLPDHDHWYHELMATADPNTPTEFMEAEDPLFIYYADTTADPILHSHAGYMVGTAISLKWVFDIRREDVYWCTADPATITGHSYLLYAPFLLGATTFLYEGSASQLQPERWAQIVNRYGISLIYSQPATIASWQQTNLPHCPSLRLIGSNAPLNADTWHWLHNQLGKEKCPILTTWQQPETGSFVLATFPSIPLKPGSVGVALPGLQTAVLTPHSTPLPPGQTGQLVIQSPWPAMFRAIAHNPDKYIQYYWDQFPDDNWYATYHQAQQDEDNYFWLL